MGVPNERNLFFSRAKQSIDSANVTTLISETKCSIKSKFSLVRLLLYAPYFSSATVTSETKHCEGTNLANFSSMSNF